VTTVGQPERATQDRAIALFRNEPGCRYLGDWIERDGNSNIEEARLSASLPRRGSTPAQISVALHKLRTEADNHSRTLYGNNQAVYSLVRYACDSTCDACIDSPSGRGLDAGFAAARALRPFSRGRASC